jgi:hypothetical protein
MSLDVVCDRRSIDSPIFQAHLAQLAANVADALRGSATSSSNKGDAIDSKP